MIYVNTTKLFWIGEQLNDISLEVTQICYELENIEKELKKVEHSESLSVVCESIYKFNTYKLTIQAQKIHKYAKTLQDIAEIYDVFEENICDEEERTVNIDILPKVKASKVNLTQFCQFWSDINLIN